MITQIQPVLVSRGVTSNAISYYTNYDNQATNATWWVGYGNLVAQENGDPTFVQIDNQAVNLSMEGEDYADWSGSAAQAQAWMCAQLDVKPV